MESYNKTCLGKNSFYCRCIAATIVVEILFDGSASKRLERKACVPPSKNFFNSLIIDKD